MGNLISQLTPTALDRMASYWSRPRRILLLGLDYAGKTTLLYKLKLGEVVTTIPTIGFNVETVQYKNIEFVAWDIGSTCWLRRLWRHYFQNADAVIFVVDAADRDRIDEAADELHTIFQNDELKDTNLLVFANKQDRPDCMKLHELREKLDLSAGVYEGLDWLAKAITGK